MIVLCFILEKVLFTESLALLCIINVCVYHAHSQGKPTECSTSHKDYGQLQAASIVPGMELVDLESDEPSEVESEGEESKW